MEPTTTTPSASGKIITALIVGLLVGFAMGVFWQNRRTSVAVNKEETKEVSTELSGMGGKESMALAEAGAKSLAGAGAKAETKETETAVVTGGLVVADQKAGSLVEISGVNAKETLWVAVREEKDGNIGNILGAQKVFAGAGQKVSVELLRPTTPGGTYLVTVYRDAGKTDFNSHEDVLVEGVGGRFTAR
ncbi:MAG: hypothetical protein Q7R64_02345 [bacterium]|nr:hypothetical protein [bacterium]